MKKSTIKIQINENGEVGRVVGNVGRTRMNRAAAALWEGNIEPTFGYKLRRFIRRFAKTADAWLESCAAIALGSDEAAEEIGFIGLEEHV